MFVRTLESGGGGGYNVCSLPEWKITVSQSQMKHKSPKVRKSKQTQYFRNSKSIKYFLKFPFQLKKAEVS